MEPAALDGAGIAPFRPLQERLGNLFPRDLLCSRKMGALEVMGRVDIVLVDDVD